MTQSTLPRRPQPKRRAHINAESVLRAINPSNRRRFLVTVCFPLFVLVCLPWWWYTTSIERLPLPKERIEVLENARVSAAVGVWEWRAVSLRPLQQRMCFYLPQCLVSAFYVQLLSFRGSTPYTSLCEACS
jgi:hypothetical protein